MSLIFGIVDFSKKKNPTKAFDQMYQGLSRFPSKRFQEADNEFGKFGTLIRENRLSSKYDEAPLKYEYLLVSNFSRIDNRKELFHVFDLDVKDINHIPDSVLIAKAYLLWGASWGKHVLGEYVVAIWDEKKQKQY